MIYFTSDNHFGHVSIIGYCNRPFKSTDEMDATMIARWNKKVDHDDLVYVLGDFTLQARHKARDYFAQLNGRIMVLGNYWHHDKNWLRGREQDQGKQPIKIVSKSKHPIQVVSPIFIHRTHDFDNVAHNPHGIVLCHYPIAVWERKHYGFWHVYGHVHGRTVFPDDYLAYDVGVDSNNFEPVSMSDLAYKMGLKYTPEKIKALRRNEG